LKHPDRFSKNGKNGEKRLMCGRKTVNKRIKNRRGAQSGTACQQNGIET
jgi:hypothetical protein